MKRITENKKVLTHRDHVFFLVVTFLYWFSLYIYVPILTPFIESMNSSYFLVGVVLSSYAVMQIILRLPMGIFSDFMKMRKSFIILGLATSFISCLGFAYSTNLISVIVFRAISGVTAATWVAFTVLYSSYFVREEATKAMANIQSVTVTAQLVAMGLSGLVVTYWGWRSPFFIGTFVAIIGLILSFWLKEPQDNNKKSTLNKNELYEVFQETYLVRASFLSIFAHCILFITMFGFTPAQALLIGASTIELSILVFAFMIPHAIAPIISRRFLVEKFGIWNTLIISFVLTGIFTVCIPFITDINMLYVSQAFNGFGQGISLSLLLGIAIQNIDHEKRATAMGFYQSVYAIGILIGPLFAGMFSSSTGLMMAFLVAFMISVIATVIILIWMIKDRADYSRSNKTEKNHARIII